MVRDCKFEKKKNRETEKILLTSSFGEKHNRKNDNSMASSTIPTHYPQLVDPTRTPLAFLNRAVPRLVNIDKYVSIDIIRDDTHL
jgi:hypothetical protein